MTDTARQRMFEKVGREGTHTEERHVAVDLVEGGKCGSYDEAYDLLNGLNPEQVVSTYRGHFRKS